MTRPDVFGLARECVHRGGADYSELEMNRLATALLALEPVWQAAQEWDKAQRRCGRRSNSVATDLANREIAARTGDDLMNAIEIAIARDALGGEASHMTPVQARRLAKALARFADAALGRETT